MRQVTYIVRTYVHTYTYIYIFCEGVKTTLSPWSAINANNRRPAAHLASPRRRRIYRSRIMYKADSTSFIFFSSPLRQLQVSAPENARERYNIHCTHYAYICNTTTVYNNMYESYNVALVRSIYVVHYDIMYSNT